MRFIKITVGNTVIEIKPKMVVKLYFWMSKNDYYRVDYGNITGYKISSYKKNFQRTSYRKSRTKLKNRYMV